MRIYNDYKLSFVEEHYKVDGRKVRCILFCILHYPDSDLTSEFAVNGTAYCSEEDKFDEHVGKQIARAKAEVKAYEKVDNDLRKLTLAIHDELDKIEEFRCKATMVINHNEAFIVGK